MPSTKVGDITLYYENHGQHGSPLILIHGYAATTIDWIPEHIERLAGRHRVVIFDNRGVGRSEKPTTPYSMPQLAADTVGLLDALEIDNAHVMGVSMGGMIAQHVALGYPERVAALVLGCTTAGNPGHPHFISPSDDVLKILTRPLTGDRARDNRDGWRIFFSPHYIHAQRDVLEQRLTRKLAYPETPSYALELQMGAIHQHDTYARLKDIRAPTLVQTGLADILVPPQNSQYLARRIPNARLIEYTGAAHAYLDEVGLPAIDDILEYLGEADFGDI